MKRLFTLLVIFTFFVSALSVAQIQKKGETKKDKQIEKVNQRDPGIKDFDNRKLMFEQNQTKNPLFMNPPTMSPNALVTIGTGTSTQRWPFERYYNYSTCEMIYLQSEIAMSGNITKIGFNKSAGTNTAAMTNVSIYMKHTSSTTLASGNYDLTGYSLVYSGSYTNNATSGWMEVTLATGFNYDNVNNLQILVIKGNQTYLTTAASPKYYYTTGTSRMRNGYSDTGQPLALTASTANPNVRFNITPSSSPSLSCTPSSLAFGYVQSGGTSSTMTYSLSGTNLTAGPIVVTAPTNFEVSLDGSTWASSVNVTYTAPTLASTTIYTHFKPTSPNTAYSGNITNVGGGTSINVAVTGNSYMYARYCTSNATDFADEDIFNVTLGSINNASDCNTTAPGPGSIKNQYSNYTTTVTPTNLAQGSANAFSVSSGTCGGNYGNGFKIFIDFNQDGDFADAGEEVYVSAVAGGGPHTETGYITVPGGATLGNTMMRVINVETTTPSTITACGTYYWGETEDYTVNIIAGSPMSYSSSDVIQIGRPAPLSTTNNQILKIPVVVSGLLSPYSITDFNLGINGTTTASDISVARIYYTGTSSTFATTTQFGNFSNPTGDYTINGSQLLTPGTNYFWVAYDLSGTATLNNQLDGQCYSIVGDGTMGSVNPTNTDPAGVSYIDNYCYGTTTTDPTGYGLNISNVTIGTINSTTGSTGIMPYMNNNYTNLSTDITQGATVPISLSRTGTVNNQGFGVWIDYNQNGSFTDAGELVYTGLLTGTTLTTSGNIVVPMTATAGNTRMRVRSSFSSAPVLADACSNLSYSETEDYKVNILLASSMAYTSSTTTQITGNTFINSTNQQIIGIQVVTTGTSSPLTVTDIALNTTGTTNQATDITNAKLFYTGISNTFATTTQFGTTVAAPVDAYNIAGSQNLLEGTNYFWLTYDIPPGATGGNYIDAECTQITIGSTYVPTITAPTGNRLIAGTMSGSYAIGSGVFNKVTGKNLHQVEKTRTAKVLVPVEEKDSEIRYEERLVEEKYYEMYEGDKPYSGKLVASIGTNQTKNGDPRMSPDYTEVFADISTAINNLNARGITGAIVFELTDASYSTGAVTINAITGASATNTITFKPQAGETVSITGSSATGIFNLNGSDYVIFDGSNSGGTDRSLTITNTNVGSTYAINFSGTGNDYNTIKNCNINSEYRGINIANANTTLIENNNIYGNAAGNLNYSQAGIYIGTGSLNTTVSKNVIHDYYYTGTGGWGAFGVIYASDATTVTQISNNLFYNLLGGGDPGSITYNTSGIFISTGGNVKIYNNSIYMLGDVLGAGTYSGWSSCISINSGITLLDIRNNALRNSMGRIAAGTTAPLLYVIYSLSANTAYTDINYNDYYFTDQASVTEYLGYLGVNCANLTAWAAATGKDGYSVSGNPGFTSATNLVPNTGDANSWVLSGNGTHIATVTDDFAGGVRPADVTEGAPDIGAYEFTAGSSTPNSFTITPAAGSNNIFVNGRKLVNLNFGVLGGISSIAVQYYSGITPPGMDGYPSATFMNGYFKITPTGGSGFTYDITYYYSPSQRGTVVNENLITISKSDNNGTNWDSYTVAGTGSGNYELNTTTKTIKIYGLSSFSIFTNTGSDSPLPVQLSSFSSTLTGRDVKLAWKTETEINNAGFDVERKLTGTNEWNKAGFVAGKGTMNSPVNYTFDDKKLNSGKYNYRLKQIDYNGNFAYHNLTSVVDVALPTKFNLSQNYPNPFNPTTKIDFDLPFDSKVNIILYDMTGREVKTLVNEGKMAGYYTVQFNASDLSSGTYFYRIMTKSADKDFVATKKMVLIK